MGLLRSLFRRDRNAKRSATLAPVDERQAVPNTNTKATFSPLPPSHSCESTSSPNSGNETTRSGSLHLQPLGPGDEAPIGSPAAHIVASIRETVDYTQDDFVAPEAALFEAFAAWQYPEDAVPAQDNNGDKNSNNNVLQEASHHNDRPGVQKIADGAPCNAKNAESNALDCRSAEEDFHTLAADQGQQEDVDDALEREGDDADELIFAPFEEQDEGVEDEDEDKEGDGSRGHNGLNAHQESSSEIPHNLTPIIYLTEDVEAEADTISVVSDGRGDDSYKHPPLTELGKTLQLLELEADAAPNSPSAGSFGRRSVSITTADNDSLGVGSADVGAYGQVPRGTSPEGSFSGTSVDATVSAAPEQLSKNLVKLYNDLALQLMETQHDYTQALAMLHKAEAVLDNDAAWVMPPNGSQVVGMTVGSIDSGGMHYTTSDVEELGGTIDEVSERIAAKRARLRAITYNNLGCLFKRRGQPSEALGYLSSALALEQAAGNVHDCASTHLNLCASYSALGRFTEALTHAERAILLLQRHLWGGAASSFQDGVAYLSRTVAALQSAAVPLAHADHQPSVAQPPHVGASSLTTTTHPKNAHTDAPTTVSAGTAGISTTNGAALTAALEAQRRHRALIAAVTVLAMAYHNAGVEHERLSKMREAQVSYHRACVLGMRFLGAKASTTVALTRAQRAFVARRQAANGGGGVSGGGNAGAGAGHGHGQGGYGGGGHGKRGPSALVSRGSAQRLASGGSRRVGSRVNKSGAAGKGGRR